MSGAVGHKLVLGQMIDRRIKRLVKADKKKPTGDTYWRHKEILYIKARLKQKGIL